MTTWPALPLSDWQNTRDTLHRWTQIVGKVQLALTPTINHWWNVPLQVSARGLRTRMLPLGDRWADLELDFVADVLRIRTSDGGERTVALAPRSVADFYAETMANLRFSGIDCAIWPVPVECEDTVPFPEDEHHCSYDRDAVRRFWTIVAHGTAVLSQFRARFLGKASPVHFFWGSFDLATSRFSGRRAPAMPGANVIEREGYSHEVSSVGWWPGDSRLPQPAFYSYAAPEPAGFADAPISTPHTYYHRTLKGFYLHHDDLRRADDPDALLLDFCQRTYAAAADLADWDRDELEREVATPVEPVRQWPPEPPSINP